MRSLVGSKNTMSIAVTNRKGKNKSKTSYHNLQRATWHSRDARDTRDARDARDAHHSTTSTTSTPRPLYPQQRRLPWFTGVAWICFAASHLRMFNSDSFSMSDLKLRSPPRCVVVVVVVIVVAVVGVFWISCSICRTNVPSTTPCDRNIWTALTTKSRSNEISLEIGGFWMNSWTISVVSALVVISWSKLCNTIRMQSLGNPNVFSKLSCVMVLNEAKPSSDASASVGDAKK